MSGVAEGKCQGFPVPWTKISFLSVSRGWDLLLYSLSSLSDYSVHTARDSNSPLIQENPTTHGSDLILCFKLKKVLIKIFKVGLCEREVLSNVSRYAVLLCRFTVIHPKKLAKFGIAKERMMGIAKTCEYLRSKHTVSYCSPQTYMC